MNDIQIGRIGRALRHRANLTQVELGARTGVSQGAISLFERGRLGGMPVAKVRRILGGLDAELVLLASWRGGDLDRMLDARHARLVERVTRSLGERGWLAVPEVSFSTFGERGSIDLVGWHEATSTLLIVEVKSEITSIEETLRKHDAKVRLGPTVVRDPFGWRARWTARLLVLPEHRTIRRQIEDKPALFGRAYPDRAVAVRHWLGVPDRALAGLMFLPDTNDVRGMRGPSTRKRVRMAPPSVDQARRSTN
jgi:transcriptional regulator with XRE-family HTH domain